MVLFGKNKIDVSIERLIENEPSNGYYLAFSGGKDSIVIKRLAEIAGVKFRSYYADTKVDPPELMRFIKELHKDVIIHTPKKGFLELLAEYGVPLKRARWCCRELKACYGKGETIITGVRAAESKSRANRSAVEVSKKQKGKMFVHAIYEWDTAEVWGFIKKEKIPYCSLYDEGWTRIGCLFCTMAAASEKRMHLMRYPDIAKEFIKAFEEFYKRATAMRPERVRHWKGGEDMFYRWISNSKIINETEEMF